MPKLSRTLAVLCLLFVLALPAVAQANPRHEEGWSSLLSSLWSRIAAPLADLWRSSEMQSGSKPTLPNGPNPTLDGRGACDPDGLTACGS